jgi:hypothetical protein
MKTFVFDTGALPRVLNTKQIYWIEDGKTTSKVLLVSTPAPIGATLTEIDDGTEEREIREAIQAAALACDWALAYEIVTRYGLSACLRCGEDVSQRPTWRLQNFSRMMCAMKYTFQTPEVAGWGEICGGCAAKMLKEGA